MPEPVTESSELTSFKEILYQVWRNGRDGIDRYETVEIALEAHEKLIARERQKAVEETSKAYGGCTNCYGKGYATYRTEHGGYATDGDIGGLQGKFKSKPIEEMVFCKCDRGKQLEQWLATQSNKGEDND